MTEPNPVNARIGRHRPAPRKRAHRKHVRQVANDLVKATDWRGEIARAGQDVIDIEDCHQVYDEYTRPC
jgi:hypothetical protein